MKFIKKINGAAARLGAVGTGSDEGSISQSGFEHTSERTIADAAVGSSAVDRHSSASHEASTAARPVDRRQGGGCIPVSGFDR